MTHLAALRAATTLRAACDGPTSEESAPEPETREVEHAMGVAEVPADPQRVVVLDTGELDDALALALRPVGALRIDVATGFLSYLEGQTQKIEEVGTISEPNLEKIAPLNPGLILSSTIRHEAIYEQLNEIAPTVLAPDLDDTWKENLLLYAEALNKSEEAQQMLSEFQDQAAQLGVKIGTGKSLSIVRFLTGQIRLYSDQSLTGVILDDMGLTVPEPAIGEDTDRAKVTAGPLWKKIPAVKAGEAHELNADLLSGIGIQAAQQILDQFDRELG